MKNSCVFKAFWKKLVIYLKRLPCFKEEEEKEGEKEEEKENKEEKQFFSRAYWLKLHKQYIHKWQILCFAYFATIKIFLTFSLYNLHFFLQNLIALNYLNFTFFLESTKSALNFLYELLTKLCLFLKLALEIDNKPIKRHFLRLQEKLLIWTIIPAD